MTMTQTHLGRRLRAARALAGLDQLGMARILNVGRSTVSNWETGVSEPDATAFVRWARVTGQSLEWLAEGIEKAPADIDEGLESYTPRDSNPEPTDYGFTFPTVGDLIELWGCDKAIR